MGGCQYINGVLQFMETSEGYMNHTGGNYSYGYNYTDHLGNIRLSYTQNPNGQDPLVLEENHYYPFGMKQEKYHAEQLVFFSVRGRMDNFSFLQLGPSTFSKTAKNASSN